MLVLTNTFYGFAGGIINVQLYKSRFRVCTETIVWWLGIHTHCYGDFVLLQTPEMHLVNILYSLIFGIPDFILFGCSMHGILLKKYNFCIYDTIS